VKRFDKLQLAEPPFNSFAYSSDRQTFVMITRYPLSVVIKDPCLFLKVQFQTYAVISCL